MRDKSQEREFFFEITDKKGNKRRIAVADIEQIEPLQGTKFYLHYYVSSLTSDLLSLITSNASQTMKSEMFQSRHLAEIMDCFEQLCQTMEEQETQLNNYIERTNSLQANKHFEDISLENNEIVEADLLDEDSSPNRKKLIFVSRKYS